MWLKQTLFILVFCCGSFLLAADSTDDFKSWFDQAQKGDLKAPSEAAALARQKHYVFVYGFNNELLPGYFSENVSALRALAGKGVAIDIVATHSNLGLKENRVSVQKQFDAILKKAKYPLVIVGHSRGGSHAVLWALQHPKEVSERVHSVLSVNGAFGGSLLADYFLGLNTDVSGMSWADWTAFKAWSVGGVAVTPKLRPGYKELATGNAQSLWKDALKNHAEAIPVLAPKLFYVRASTSASQMSSMLSPGAAFIAQSGANDGVILFSGQRLESLGKVVMDLEGDHHDLVHFYPAAGTGAQYRKNFSYAIFRLGGLPLGPAPQKAP